MDSTKNAKAFLKEVGVVAIKKLLVIFNSSKNFLVNILQKNKSSSYYRLL